MNNIVGKGVTRVDAYAKVTGEAKYTSDLEPRDCLCARVVHSTIANGLVKRFDLEDALKVPGVVKIVTCFDVPEDIRDIGGIPRLYGYLLARGLPETVLNKVFFENAWGFWKRTF